MAVSVLKSPVSVDTSVEGVYLFRFGKLRILHINKKDGSASIMTLDERDRPSSNRYFPLVGVAGSNTYVKLGILTVESSGTVYKAAYSNYNSNTSATGFTEYGSALGIWTVG